MMVVAGAAAVWCAVPLAAAAAPAATWHNAIEVPGTATLNTGGIAGVQSLSCASAGKCSAGGYYAYTTSNGHKHDQAFVVSESGGTWGDAIEVPGIAALNIGRDSGVGSVSCASAGNCAAVGDYADSANHSQAFVVSESAGTWGNAIELPGTAALNTGGDAQVHAVSCRSAGNCAAGGSYTDGTGQVLPFVASESAGTWGAAIEVPGMATLNKGGAIVDAVSCGSAGNCVAGGSYTDAAHQSQAFVVSQSAGTWHTAIELPGTAALNTGGDAQASVVSCGSAGNCAAGGSYSPSDGPEDLQPFVASESDGTWHTAIEVPGIAALNINGAGFVNGLSCPSAGNCALVGGYDNGHLLPFVASESGGTWGSAIEVPGTAALNQGRQARLYSVSCGAAGNCATGGSYYDGSGHYQAFVANES
jgi:hypothetical protein